MLKVIRKHQKKLLAVFAAGLMIVFVADQGIRQLMPQERVDPRGRLVGTFADREIRIADVRWAERQLQLLDQIRLEDPDAPPEHRQPITVWEVAGIPPQALADWGRAPVTFALLKAEAERMPAYVSQAQLEGILRGVAALQWPDGRLIAVSEVPQLLPEIRASIRDLLLVTSAFTRSTDIVKVSQPYVQRAAAEQAQQLTVSLVRVPADEMVEHAPQPSEPQLSELFEKYADVRANEPSEANPLGLGYRLPDRLTLQYIALPQQQVRSVVAASRDDYEWELEAQRYYQRNLRQFPAPAVDDDPAAEPTTRPFEDVRDEVLERVMAPEVQRISDAVRRQIESTMATDYQAWAATRGPATAPADAPRPTLSSLGVPYDSYEYLEALAALIQEQHGVLPTVASLGEYRSREQLSEMPGIGRFANEAFEKAVPLATTQPAAARNRDRDRLNLYQPSRARVDAFGDAYVFWLTGVSAAHAPQELAEVRELVERDWKLKWAWEWARDEAEALAEHARESDLHSAAGERAASVVGPLQRFSFAPVAGITFRDWDSQMWFIQEAFKLVSDLAADPAQRHPVRLIDMPQDREYYVVQLVSLENIASPQELQLLAREWPLRQRDRWAQLTAPEWFSLTGVAARLKYTPAEDAELDPDAAAPDRAAALP